MSIYISTFTMEFRDIAKVQIVKDLLGVKVINIYVGLIHYRYNSKCNEIKKVSYLNNTFSVLSVFINGKFSFSKMISTTNKGKHSFFINGGHIAIDSQRRISFQKLINIL